MEHSGNQRRSPAVPPKALLTHPGNICPGRLAGAGTGVLGGKARPQMLTLHLLQKLDLWHFCGFLHAEHQEDQRQASLLQLALTSLVGLRPP